MRRLFLTCGAFVALALPARAQTDAPKPVTEIASAEQCEAAVAADPAAAREQAAIWFRLGGGTPARLCEAAALEAIGADATAAQILTSVAQNGNRAIDPEPRAAIFEDAARLWLRSGRADLARAALASASRLTDPTPDRLTLRARAEAAEDDWPAALATLDTALVLRPDDALTLALRAAARRHTGDLPGAEADAARALVLSPDLPEALFEQAAALAESGDAAGATNAWLRLIETHPRSDLAPLARRNLQMLSSREAAPAPIARPLEQPGPRPRPDPPPRG